jgi:hypothetical protein
MERLRISAFQVAILRRIRQGEQAHGGCSPSSPNSKLVLYGRRRGFSTAERVTLHRSVKRLVANGMIAAKPGTTGWFRLTKKGSAWLDAVDRAAKPPATFFGQAGTKKSKKK